MTRGTVAAPIPPAPARPDHWYLKCRRDGRDLDERSDELTAVGDALELTYQVSQAIATQSGGDVCMLVQTHTAGQSDTCTQCWVPAGGTQASGRDETLSPNLAGFRITYPASGNYKASLSAAGALSVTSSP